jgi:hypothetical protein
MTRITVTTDQLDTVSTPFTLVRVNDITIMPVEVETVEIYNNAVVFIRPDVDPGPPFQINRTDTVTVRID